MTAASRDDTRRARGRGVWNTLTEPAASIEELEARQQARLLAAVLVLFMPLATVGTIVSAATIGANLLERPAFLVLLIGIALGIPAYVLSRTRYYVQGAVLASILLPFSLLSSAWFAQNIYNVLPYLAVGVLLTSLLLSFKAVLAQVSVSLVGMALVAILRPDMGFLDIVNPFIFVFSISVLILVSSNLRRRDLMRVLRRTEQLRSTTVVSQVAAVTRDLPDLLNTTVNLISRAFGFYHVQVFLIDPAGETALLRASTGEAGRELLRRGHRLPVGSTSIVGQVTARGELLVASDVSTDPIHRRNELLPLTRSEMALPMRVGERVIGALDVQSTQVNAFGEEDIETVQMMANQLAVTIENARLLNEVTQRAADNERLLKETQANLQQIETLNRTLTRRGWHEYLRLRAKEGMLGYTLHAGQVVGDTRWTPGMRAAVQEQRVVVGEDSGPGRTLSLPLSVRGEVIGVLEIEGESAQTWTADDVELAQALAERLSMALDNARLLEQADTLARREQLVNEITQSVQKADSVDTLLQSALMELGRVLGASKGVVQLNPRAEEAGSTASGGGTGKLSLPADSVVSEEERA